MKSGVIFDIKRFALHDGPGTRTTLFLKGCPLACAWCHNPEGISTQPALIYHRNRCLACGDCVEACKRHAIAMPKGEILRLPGCDQCGDCAAACPANAWEISGRTVDVSEIMEQLEKDFLFFDQSQGGLTFSGGEPLLQVDFLEALLKSAKQRGFHTAVDTSGFAPLDHFLQINRVVDLYLYDIKCMDEQKHTRFTGVSNRLIRENFIALAAIAAEIIVRIPLIPGFNDQPTEIAAIGAFIKQHSRVKRVDLLPYHAMAREKYTRLHREYLLDENAQVDPALLVTLREILEEIGFLVTIGG